jgi:hypothetical protein
VFLAIKCAKNALNPDVHNLPLLRMIRDMTMIAIVNVIPVKIVNISILPMKNMINVIYVRNAVNMPLTTLG